MPYMESDNNQAINKSFQLGEKYILEEGFVYFILYQVIVPIIFSTIIITGISGNGLVIYVILVKDNLRTVINILLLNLAIADIGFLLICGVFTTIYFALAVWPFGDVLCRLVQYLLYVTCYVTVYTLVAISVMRYLVVMHGVNSHWTRSKRNSVIVCIVIWLTFLIAKIPILIVHGVSRNYDTKRQECIISGRLEAQQLFSSFFVFAYALPLTVTVVMYLSLLCVLRRQTNAGISQSNADARNRHVTKIIILIVTVFAIGWLPLHIHLLVSYYSYTPNTFTYAVLLIVWHIFMFSVSVLNPIIYNYFSQEFQHAFKEVVCCSKEPPCTEV